jgi:hypothetical protein
VNLLLLNPLWFLVAVAVARDRGLTTRWRRLIQLIAIMAGVGALIGIFGVPQRSVEVVLLAGPPSLAVLLYLLRRAHA